MKTRNTNNATLTKNEIGALYENGPKDSHRPRKAAGNSALKPGIPKKEWDGADIPAQLQISDILDALPFYVMLLDEHHHILRANAAVRQHLGLSPEEIVGKYCPEVIHGLKEPWYACPLEESVETGQVVEREALDKDSGHWIRAAIYPVKISAGDKLFFHMVSDITDRKQAEEQLIASRKQLGELSRHLEGVREEERANMAREIHDELGQTLATLKIYLSWLIKKMPAGQESLLEQAKPMYNVIDNAIQTVMRISTEIRPGVLDDLGLAPAVEWQVKEFKKLSGIKTEFTSNAKDIVLDRERSTAIFRICQEALTNILRHADATSVRMSLSKRNGRIVLRVSDNGKGIEEKRIADPGSFGLIGMRERARFWGGEVKIKSAPGRGTTVVVSIPLADMENPDAEISKG